MANIQKVLCIGSVLWDVIGRAEIDMPLGADRPGLIQRLPGGVAMNIAMALGRLGLEVELLSAVGRDDAGIELLKRASNLGLGVSHVYHQDLPTDIYMAVEASNGLIAAIADAHSLEAAGAEILAPLSDGRLADDQRPWTGIAALDGNLTAELLGEIARGDYLAAADLRIAPASPGKAKRLLPFLANEHATLYVNLEEANLLLNANHQSSDLAAKSLMMLGLGKAVVTNGGQAASIATRNEQLSIVPPAVDVRRITGAGDTFMAAHIASEANGADLATAFQAALDTAATYISSKDFL